MSALNKEDLKKVLDQIFDLLVEEKMIPPGIGKENIVEGVISQFNQNNIELTGDELERSATRKALCVSLISEVVASKNSESQFNYTQLFNKGLNKETNPLSELFKKILEPKLSPTGNKSKVEEARLNALIKEIDNRAEKLYDKYNKMGEESFLAQNTQAIDYMADVLSLALASFYGVDPRGEGGKIAPVIQATLGNLSGQLNYNTGGGESLTLASDQHTLELKPDYTGTSFAFKLPNAISLDAINTGLEGILDPIIHPHFNPWHTKLTPPPAAGG
jgi:hypothetical protein